MSEPGATIRSATSEDIPRLLELLGPFVDANKLLPRTADEIDDLVACGFVAEQAGGIVGFAALEIYSPKLAEIRSLAVDSAVQGAGIGSRLVKACVDRARQHGVLEILAVTSAEKFFKSCGFDFTLPGEKQALFFSTRREA